MHGIYTYPEHTPGGRGAARFGVPVVLEQKTTILWKYLYLLVSLKDSVGLGVTYETKRRSEEENPVHRQNTTVARGRTTALTLRLIPAEQVHRLWRCGGCRR